jgi:hypothetical protein
MISVSEIPNHVSISVSEIPNHVSGSVAASKERIGYADWRG